MWIKTKAMLRKCHKLTSAAIFPNVSRPNCLNEIKWLCAESNRKRRQVRLAAKSLTLPSSKERFRKITAIWSTRWPSMSLMPSFRGGWNKDSQSHSPDVSSTTENTSFPETASILIIVILKYVINWLVLTNLPWALFRSEMRSRTSLSSTMSFQNCNEKCQWFETNIILLWWIVHNTRLYFYTVFLSSCGYCYNLWVWIFDIITCFSHSLT